jgi:hypothetical protein
VYAYDADLTFDGGGAYLAIVIAAPLDASTRSIARLQERLRFYLDSFYSEFGQKTWGTPVTGKIKIYVRVHPNSSDQTFQILLGKLNANFQVGVGIKAEFDLAAALKALSCARAH